MTKKPKYGCSDYRKEMILLKLRKRLEENALTPEEQAGIKLQIEELEKEMGLV
jgi:hypothetical protein